jgi:MFS transporter, NNP family, nitrate/nitrite transporter
VASWQAVFGLAMLPVALAWIAFLLMARDASGGGGVKKWRDYAAILQEADAWWFCFLYAITFGGFVGMASYLATFFHSQYYRE